MWKAGKVVVSVQDVVHRLQGDGALAGYEVSYAIQAVTARIAFLAEDAPELWFSSLHKIKTFFGVP